MCSWMECTGDWRWSVELLDGVYWRWGVEILDGVNKNSALRDQGERKKRGGKADDTIFWLGHFPKAGLLLLSLHYPIGLIHLTIKSLKRNIF